LACVSDDGSLDATKLIEVVFDAVNDVISTRPLSGVVIGGGAMGAMHLRVLHGFDKVGSLALVEPNLERRSTLQRQYPRVRTHSELAPALAENPDFACVAVPVSAAPTTSAEVINAGVPQLLEKPMAPSVGEARALAELAAEKGVLLSIGYVERFNPAVQALRAELRRGIAGPLYHVHARRLSPFPQRQGLPGVATDLATHDLDVMRFLVDSEPMRIYAETEFLSASRGEDLLCASVRFANGVTGLVEANWHTPSKVRQLTVTGELGMFVISYLTQDLSFHEHPRARSEWETLGVMSGANEGRVIRFGLRRREPLAVEWEEFLRAVGSSGPAPVSPEDGIAALVAAEAIIEAGQTHLPVIADRSTVT
jgi:predicted dehydrogenase